MPYISSATTNSEAVWASNEGLKIALSVASEKHLHGIQIQRVISWPL